MSGWKKTETLPPETPVASVAVTVKRKGRYLGARDNSHHGEMSLADLPAAKHVRGRHARRWSRKIEPCRKGAALCTASLVGQVTRRVAVHPGCGS